MSLALALNGMQVGTLDLTIPYVGLWSADATILTPAALPAAAGGLTLTVGNLSLLGTVYRASSFAGARSARIVGGYGGWRQPIPPRAYANPAGNPIAMVLGDLAAHVGEKVLVAAAVTLPSSFAVQGSTPDNPVPASRVLRQVAGGMWWVDGAGVTHIGPRPSSAITTPFTVVAWSGARGSFDIATEDPASWQPGNVFSSDTVTTAQTISSVSIRSVADGVMRLRVLSTGEQVAA